MSTINEILEVLDITETPSMGNLICLIYELIQDDDIEVDCEFGIEFMPRHYRKEAK